MISSTSKATKRVMSPEERARRAEAARKAWQKRKAARAAAAAEAAEAMGKGKPFITEFYADKGMSQIYSSGLEFAFVSADGKQCHPFAFCKDFLQDAIWSTHNEKPVSIYGFSFGVDNPKIDIENTRVAVRYKGKADIQEACIKALSFLNALEPDFNMSQTSLCYGGDSKGSDVWVFVGDKKWMYSPPLISLYTLLIRVGLNYDGGDWQSHLNKTSFVGRNDSSYLTYAKPAIKFLVGKDFAEVFGPDWKSNYPVDCSVSSMHNNSGIQCLGQRSIAGEVSKNWKIKTIKV